MVFPTKTFDDGRTQMSDGTINSAPNTFSSGSSVSQITPNSPVIPTQLQALEQATNNIPTTQQGQQLASIGSPVQALQQDSSQQIQGAAQGVANDQANQQNIPGQPPALIQQATADFMRGMTMNQFRQSYPELQGQQELFGNFQADVSKNPAPDKLMNAYPELFGNVSQLQSQATDQMNTAYQDADTKVKADNLMQQLTTQGISTDQANTIAQNTYGTSNATPNSFQIASDAFNKGLVNSWNAMSASAPLTPEQQKPISDQINDIGEAGLQKAYTGWNQILNNGQDVKGALNIGGGMIDMLFSPASAALTKLESISQPIGTLVKTGVGIASAPFTILSSMFSGLGQGQGMDQEDAGNFGTFASLITMAGIEQAGQEPSPGTAVATTNDRPIDYANQAQDGWNKATQSDKVAFGTAVRTTDVDVNNGIIDQDTARQWQQKIAMAMQSGWGQQGINMVMDQYNDFKSTLNPTTEAVPEVNPTDTEIPTETTETPVQNTQAPVQKSQQMQQFQNYYDKGVKPSTINVGTPVKATQYYNDAATAFDTIANNPNLTLTDKNGDVIEPKNGKPVTPNSLATTAQAIDQSKQQIFQQYDAMTKKAGDQGSQVNLNDRIIPALQQLKDSRTFKDLTGGSLDTYINGLVNTFSEDNGMRNTSDAQTLQQGLNEKLQAFYRNPSSNDVGKAQIDALVNNLLKGDLDTTIEQSEGPGYSELKSTYRALRSIEGDVQKRALVLSRGNKVGLVDSLTNIASAGELIKSLVTMSPGGALSAGVMVGVKKYISNLNNPDKNITKAFQSIKDNKPPEIAQRFQKVQEKNAEIVKQKATKFAQDLQKGPTGPELPAPSGKQVSPNKVVATPSVISVQTPGTNYANPEITGNTKIVNPTGQYSPVVKEVPIPKNTPKTFDQDIYHIRHGKTTMNGLNAIRAWNDVPLSTEGEKEIADVYKHPLAKELDTIVTSNLMRAKQTAEALSHGTIPIERETSGLRPWDVGQFTGEKEPDIREQLNKYVTEYPDKKIPAGESFNEFKTRVLDEVNRIAADHPNENVGIIGHYRTQQLLKAWNAAGRHSDYSIDIPTFLEKGEEPGSVLKISKENGVSGQKIEGKENNTLVNKEKETTKNTVKEQIESNLAKKQENKEIKDIGERVAGSKKEMAQYRLLSQSDLAKVEGESAAMAKDLVTKKRVVADIYDPKSDKEAGTEPGTIYMKKKLIDSIQNSPINTPEARKTYVEKVPDMIKKISDANSLQELKDIGNNIENLYSRKGIGYFEKGGDMELSQVYGKTFLNLLKNKSESAASNWGEAELKNPLTEEERENRVQELQERIKTRQENLQNTINTQDYNKVAQSNISNWTNDQLKYFLKDSDITTKTRNSPEVIQKLADYYKERDTRSLSNLEGGLTDQFEKNPLNKVREGDYSFMEKQAQERKESTKPRIHSYQKIDKVIRTGGRDVAESEVKDLPAIKNTMEKLGYKSTQFGNYVNDTESRYHIQHFIESQKDLEDITGLNIAKMNKEGNMSMAFGARGSGGALAHYEPDYNIINLTKSKGDGSVAHEWGHFLDDFIGKEMLKRDEVKSLNDKMGLSNTEPKKNYFGMVVNKSVNPVVSAMNNVMKAIKGSKYAPTRFYKDASSLGSYWKSNHELFARAFESYIQDKGAEKGITSNYLVAPNKLADTPEDMIKLERDYAETHLSSKLETTYPQLQERQAIDERMEDLIEAVKNEFNLGKTSNNPLSLREKMLQSRKS